MMNLKKGWALAALALASGTALAAPVSMTATGQVLATDTNDGLFGIPFTSAVGVGTPVSVSFSFDLDLFGADLNADPNIGLYSGGGITARIQVGNDVFEPMVSRLGVLPGTAGPTLTTYSFGFGGLGDGNAVPPIAWIFAVNFEMESASPTEALPATMNPADMRNLRLQYTIQQGSDASAHTDAFVAAITPVPLPAGVWLLLGGIGALAPLRKRRSPGA
jgi:hypothetical protein